MVHYPEDYNYGIKNEDRVLDCINLYFNKLIKKCENKYERYDFFDDECIFELKSRKNKYNTYSTTMITANKLEQEINKQLILLFDFTDGLYYIKYDKEQFSKYFKQPFSRCGIKSDEKIHIYIPIRDLIKIF